MPKAQFSREADMLSLIASEVGKLLARPEAFHVLYEVPAASGVPDVVLIQFNQAEIRRRRAAEVAPVLDLPSIATLMALQRSRASGSGGGEVRPIDLASTVGLSVSYLSSVILPRLAEGGHVERVKPGRWGVAYSGRSLARTVMTIEAKVDDWRGGYAQALRHKAASDQAWLVIDSNRARPALAHKDWFSQGKVGLATLDEKLGLEPRIKPPKKTSGYASAYRELLAERAADLHSSGKVSGVVHHVFGSHITTSRGIDPRLQGALGS